MGIINWILDQVFRQRKSIDQQLMKEYLDESNTDTPTLKDRSETVWFIYLRLASGTNLKQCAENYGVSLEAVKAALIYTRRHPEYLKRFLGKRVSTRVSWRAIFI